MSELLNFVLNDKAQRNKEFFKLNVDGLTYIYHFIHKAITPNRTDNECVGILANNVVYSDHFLFRNDKEVVSLYVTFREFIEKCNTAFYAELGKYNRNNLIPCAAQDELIKEGENLSQNKKLLLELAERYTFSPRTIFKFSASEYNDYFNDLSDTFGKYLVAGDVAAVDFATKYLNDNATRYNRELIENEIVEEYISNELCNCFSFVSRKTAYKAIEEVDAKTVKVVLANGNEVVSSNVEKIRLMSMIKNNSLSEWAFPNSVRPSLNIHFSKASFIECIKQISYGRKVLYTKKAA